MSAIIRKILTNCLIAKVERKIILLKCEELKNLFEIKIYRIFMKLNQSSKCVTVISRTAS